MAAREVHPVVVVGEDAPLGVLAGTAPADRVLGLYVHVPFCTKRCHYCSFTTAPLDEPATVRRYLAALHREIALLGAAPWATGLALDSIFFGGGTPSLLDPEDLGAVVEAIRERFAVTRDVEVTVEANPESVTREKVEAYRAAGVNRVSLGVQALDDERLQALGRLHDAAGARAAFDAVRDAGLANVSVDLMYGLPGLDVHAWVECLRRIFTWQPNHLSAYALTLDAGSRWGSTGAEGLPPDDAVAEHYRALTREAAEHGFEHYEISNYARPGFRSRHNARYWRRGEYLACGPGAAGFVGDVRYADAKALPRYCQALEEGRLPIDTWERLDRRQTLAEQLILGLRTSDGIPAVWLDARARGDRDLARRLSVWREEGLLVATGDRVRLTEAGFLLSDALFVRLL